MEIPLTFEVRTLVAKIFLFRTSAEYLLPSMSLPPWKPAFYKQESRDIPSREAEYQTLEDTVADSCGVNLYIPVITLKGQLFAVIAVPDALSVCSFITQPHHRYFFSVSEVEETEHTLPPPSGHTHRSRKGTRTTGCCSDTRTCQKLGKEKPPWAAHGGEK